MDDDQGAKQQSASLAPLSVHPFLGLNQGLLFPNLRRGLDVWTGGNIWCSSQLTAVWQCQVSGWALRTVGRFYRSSQFGAGQDGVSKKLSQRRCVVCSCKSLQCALDTFHSSNWASTCLSPLSGDRKRQTLPSRPALLSPPWLRGCSTPVTSLPQSRTHLKARFWSSQTTSS